MVLQPLWITYISIVTNQNKCETFLDKSIAAVRYLSNTIYFNFCCWQKSISKELFLFWNRIDDKIVLQNGVDEFIPFVAFPLSKCKKIVLVSFELVFKMKKFTLAQWPIILRRTNANTLKIKSTILTFIIIGI